MDIPIPSREATCGDGNPILALLAGDCAALFAIPHVSSIVAIAGKISHRQQLHGAEHQSLRA